MTRAATEDGLSETGVFEWMGGTEPPIVPLFPSLEIKSWRETLTEHGAKPKKLARFCFNLVSRQTMKAINVRGF